ncbi:transposase [Parvimonas sp. S3374]|uniref:Transposase n=1 Tax=Parvimonas parva TaxID=2769485 RepID=A0ABS1CAV6_9FIRM|nr:transposase [Parvimonas parva]MBK1469238.1 transposase [Parvimonas parva]
MYNNCNTKHKHLTIDLRKLIKKWKKERKSNRKIANNFDFPYSNGYLDEKYNKIKTLKRITYRMGNFNNFRNKILLI